MNIERQVGLRATMSDGVALVADAWIPEGTGPFPVLLQRLPYGRSVASTPVLPHPTWFARQGYAVVVQDCRGRGQSEGVFEPFVHEGPDGAASIEWAARLPFSDGRVATYGFSYQGISQLYAAALQPPSLQAIAPLMCCPDPYEGWFFEGGAMRWPFICFWAAQLAGQELGTGPVAFDMRALPASAALGPTPPAWFVDWTSHPTDDEFWDARRPDLSRITVPAFTVLGWFDDFSSGTAELIRRLDARAWCGPWAHMPWGSLHSGVDFGADASPAPVHDALLRFFDEAFGMRGASLGAPEVNYHVINEGWRSSRTWPPTPSVESTWHAASPTGNANSRWGDGVLTTEPLPTLPSVIVSEPHVPVPGDPAGYQDESVVHDRRDVLCFTGAPLPGDLVIAGSPSVRLSTRCDQPSHDVVVTLCSVDEGHVARLLTSYAQRLLEPIPPNSPHQWEITLRPIAVRVRAGEQLRVTVSASRFPCYDRNPQTGTRSAATPPQNFSVATIQLDSLSISLPIGNS